MAQPGLDQLRAIAVGGPAPAPPPRRHKVVVAGGIVLVLAVAYPFVGGAIAARVAVGKIQDRLGVPARVGSGRAGLLAIALRDVEIGTAGTPVAKVASLRVPFSFLLFRRGTVDVDGLILDVRRGGPDDNVAAMIATWRRRPKNGGGSAGGAMSTLPAVVVRDARLSAHDAGSGLSVDVGRFGCRFVPGESVEMTAETIAGVLAFSSTGKGPRFGAKTISIAGPLDGTRPRGYPTLAITGGYATPLPNLALTGIRGKIHPPATDPTATATSASASAPAGTDAQHAKRLIVDLDGSYGGARETLWTARGEIVPAAHEGQLSLRAERFSLSEIADVLPKTVLAPAKTNVNAAFDVSWADGAVRFGGDMQVSGLNIEHHGLASGPLSGMNLALVLRGTAFPNARRVAIDRLEGRIDELRGKVSGFVELAPGTFTFADGSKLGFLPRMELTLEVPKLSCAKALASLPPALVPRLQGFALQGIFGAELSTHIDYANLEALDLKAKIGIDGCKVVKAPPDVAELVSGESVVQSVEVPKPPGARGPEDTEQMEFIIGPENPDFVPYDQISPNLIASIMTTEDNGFFKHRGWVTSEFKSALKRNLQRGGFRGGASSITMQMVKNVLLSQEKTLSRKLQELFLVWYLEHEIPKERILELYFNAIEFGPRIYGIGPAARHYFGKSASDLTPLEGAFFSSILPSPKRRYVQYCHGSLLPPWERYVHRILGKVHERGRIDDEAYESVADEKLVFDRSEATFNERQCLDWVKRMTARPEPDAPSDADAPGDGDAGADDADNGPIPVAKLRRLFSRDAKRGLASKASKTSMPASRP